jgi:cell fate regulator YaaT (PSP1 superfamily)
MNEPFAAAGATAGAAADPKLQPPEAHEVLEVAFKARRREYFANPKEIPLRTGDWIIVQAERGEDLGKVHHTHEWVKRTHLPGNLRAVLRQARPEDLERLEQNRGKEEKAFQTCKERVLHREIEMKLVDCEFQFDGNRITFFFTAEKRVDFRDLVKDLASMFRTRIELRQIGVRDESGRIGGMGSCGRELCCATWLRDFEPITLKMAKDQGLSPSPSKISGACGRLKCCLRYELDFYKESAREFPKIGSRFEMSGAEYEVGRVDIFHRTLTLRDAAGNDSMITLEEVPAGTKIVGPSRDRRKGCDKEGCGSRGAKPGDGGHDDAAHGHGSPGGHGRSRPGGARGAEGARRPEGTRGGPGQDRAPGRGVQRRPLPSFGGPRPEAGAASGPGPSDSAPTGAAPTGAAPTGSPASETPPTNAPGAERPAGERRSGRRRRRDRGPRGGAGGSGVVGGGPSRGPSA